MRMVLLGIMALAWLVADSRGQALKQASPSVAECEGASTTAMMRACADSRYAVAQRELDAAYEELMHRLDAGEKQKLRSAQRAWIRFRDANTDFEASRAHGGTLGPLLKIGSLTEMTKARAQELKKDILP